MDKKLLAIQDADDCVEQVAREYEKISYSELRTLAAAPEGRWSVMDRSFRDIPVRLTIQVNHYGLLWPRATVEIVASAEGDCSWPWTPCVYMQIFPNGRILKSSTMGTNASSVRLRSFLLQAIIYVAAVCMILYIVARCDIASW